jgi:hypothetical protein
MSIFFFPSAAISGEVSHIVCPVEHKVPIAVDKNKVFLSLGNYKYYFVWGYPDHSARIVSVDTEKVRREGGKERGLREGGRGEEGGEGARGGREGGRRKGREEL